MAKAVVFAVLAFVTAGISAFVGFLLGQLALASTHAQASLSTPHAVRAILGATLYSVTYIAIGYLCRDFLAAVLNGTVNSVLLRPRH